jgi:hypothetical protein
MAIQYNGNVMGTMVITQNGQKYKLEIRQGNCLAVIMHVCKQDDGTYLHTLMDFFADEQHLKNRCAAVDKGNDKTLLLYDTKSIKLNMRYKECATLLKHLVKYYKITCYYK